MTEKPRKKMTIRQLIEKKQAKERITALAVYDSVAAQIADDLGFDLLVAGVAGPMSYFGHKDPSSVRFEEQLFMVQAVSRVARYGFIVVDMSWGTYNTKEKAVEYATRLIAEGGADAIKAEGNKFTAPIIAEITKAGIPVMGHLGLLAAHVKEQSGYGLKGTTAEEANEIVEAARAYVKAGAFGFMLEQVTSEVTEYLATTLPVPVVSLGSGPKADGIFHISSDVLGYGLFPLPPRREQFANFAPQVEEAFRTYRDKVISFEHPKPEHAYHMKEEEHAMFLELVGEAEPMKVSYYYGGVRED